jgi:hypothetical protein
MITKEERQEALQNLVCSVAVLTWSMDLEMSSAILKETSEKYGEDLVAKLMNELLPALNSVDPRRFKNKCLLKCGMVPQILMRLLKLWESPNSPVLSAQVTCVKKELILVVSSEVARHLRNKVTHRPLGIWSLHNHSGCRGFH